MPATHPTRLLPAPDAGIRYLPEHPLDLWPTLGPLHRGRGDPTMVVEGDRYWRTAGTPAGPGLLLLVRDGPAVVAEAWGPGATWLIDGVPALLGRDDRPEDFVPAHPVLEAAHRRLAGMRFGACGLVLEVLVPAVLEQKVTGREARRAWRDLVTAYGTTPPGPAPAGMRVAPGADAWRRVPSWDWHRAGVDGRRSRAVLAAARVAGRLEATVSQPLQEVERVLRSVPGIGVWTAAEVMARAHGDADAVSYGDAHIPATVGWALLGRALDDQEMRAYLEPWVGHRGRVVRLAEQAGGHPPRFGPRYAGADYRSM